MPLAMASPFPRLYSETLFRDFIRGSGNPCETDSANGNRCRNPRPAIAGWVLSEPEHAPPPVLVFFSAENYRVAKIPRIKDRVQQTRERWEKWHSLSIIFLGKP